MGTPRNYTYIHINMNRKILNCSLSYKLIDRNSIEDINLTHCTYNPISITTYTYIRFPLIISGLDDVVMC